MSKVNGGLSPKHEQFITEYCMSGNVSQSYKSVYKDCTDETARANGYKLMQRPEIKQEIAKRQATVKAEGIATVDEIRQMWSAMLDNPNLPFKERIRVQELLMKSLGGFEHKQEIDTNVTIELGFNVEDYQ